MPTLVAVVVCVMLVAISELSRIAVSRAFGLRRAGRVAAPLVGMIAAYLVVVALAFAFYRATGVPTANLEVGVDSVPEGYPASGKLEVGDRIVAIDGAPLTKSLSSLVDERNGAAVRLTVVRRDTTLDVTIAPIGHDGHWVMGFRPSFDYVRSYDMALAAERAIRFPIDQTIALVPQIMPSEQADPGGPKRIYDEYPVVRRQPPAAILALRQSLHFVTYVLLLIGLLDLVRAARAVTAR